MRWEERNIPFTHVIKPRMVQGILRVVHEHLYEAALSVWQIPLILTTFQGLLGRAPFIREHAHMILFVTFHIPPTFKIEHNVSSALYCRRYIFDIYINCSTYITPFW